MAHVKIMDWDSWGKKESQNRIELPGELPAPFAELKTAFVGVNVTRTPDGAKVTFPQKETV